MPDRQTLELIIAVLNQEALACEALVRRYYRSCYAVALSVMRHPEDAEDAAQASLFTALRKLDTLADHRKFRPWILRITRNHALNLLQRRNRHEHRRHRAREPDDMGVNPHRPALRDALVKALKVLSEREREVLLLHDMDGWKHKEIATLMEIAENNSRQLLFAARKKMRKALKEQ